MGYDNIPVSNESTDNEEKDNDIDTNNNSIHGRDKLSELDENQRIFLKEFLKISKLNIDEIEISTSIEGNQKSIIFAIKLEAKGKDGYIPDSIEYAINLEEINLSKNNFGDKIPNAVGNLYNLKYLFLNENKFEGYIPSTIGNLKNLKVLDLSQNLLEGKIPQSIGDLTNLEVLNLSYNKLEGHIPSNIGNLKLLKELYLQSNELKGSIPSGVCKLNNLTKMNLGYNKLSGEIPSSVGNLIELTELNLEHNSLKGRIQYSIGNLTNLTVLNVKRNNLSGHLPYSLGNLTNLITLELNYNPLVGLIPIPVHKIINDNNIQVEFTGTNLDEGVYDDALEMLQKFDENSEKYKPFYSLIKSQINNFGNDNTKNDKDSFPFYDFSLTFGKYEIKLNKFIFSSRCESYQQGNLEKYQDILEHFSKYTMIYFLTWIYTGKFIWDFKMEESEMAYKDIPILNWIELAFIFNRIIYNKQMYNYCLYAVHNILKMIVDYENYFEIVSKTIGFNLKELVYLYGIYYKQVYNEKNYILTLKLSRIIKNYSYENEFTNPDVSLIEELEICQSYEEDINYFKHLEKFFEDKTYHNVTFKLKENQTIGLNDVILYLYFRGLYNHYKNEIDQGDIIYFPTILLTSSINTLIKVYYKSYKNLLNEDHLCEIIEILEFFRYHERDKSISEIKSLYLFYPYVHRICEKILFEDKINRIENVIKAFNLVIEKEHITKEHYDEEVVERLVHIIEMNLESIKDKKKTFSPEALLYLNIRNIIE